MSGHSIKIHGPLYTGLLTTGFSITAAAVIFFSLYTIFERITIRAVVQLDNEFVAQIDALTESVSSSIINFGMEIYYSDECQTLMNAVPFSNTTRVYCLRGLENSTHSVDYVNDIIVYNSNSGHVYSTNSPEPDCSIVDYDKPGIRELLLSNDTSLRFKPFYIKEDTYPFQEYYAFIFYELNADGTRSSGILVVTIDSGWYQKAVLAANPNSNLIVLDSTNSILISNNDTLEHTYIRYYPLISEENSSGYIKDKEHNEICIYYRSPVTGYTYMKISSMADTLPSLTTFRRIVSCILAGIICVFALAVIGFLLFAVSPMTNMKRALADIKNIQEGRHGNSRIPENLPLKETLDIVVQRSERTSLEHVFYDMLSGQNALSPQLLFKAAFGPFGLFLIRAPHRSDVYNQLGALHREALVTKFSYICVCIAVYESEQDYQRTILNLAGTLRTRCFFSQRFEDFNTLTEHFSKLNELRKMNALFPPDRMIIPETELDQRITNSLTAKDFADFSNRLRTGNLSSISARWDTLIQELLHYRFDDFQYVLYRLEDAVVSALEESAESPGAGKYHLLPESIEDIQNLEELNNTFQLAFVKLCNQIDKKKNEKYTSLSARVKEIIDQRYHDESLNSQTIAESLGLNSNYLGKMFKSAFQYSINDYITLCRIQEAQRLLTQSGETVDEIARQVGCSNTKYFFVLFKKHTGLTPAQYRRQS